MPSVMMTHNELVARAVKWLYSQGCGFAIGEKACATNTGEIPDAIGFKSHFSMVIECKTSKADFKADKKKYFRFKQPKEGMGNLRFYLCEEGVILPEDLPEKWGLLYVKNKNIKKIVCPKGNVWNSDQIPQFWHEKNYIAENTLLYSCLRKI